MYNLSVPEPFSLAIDVTPLFGNQTGVGAVTRAYVRRFAARTDIDVSGVLVSFRGRSQLASLLPAGVNKYAVGVPARVAHFLWKRCDWPRLSGFDIVHGTNYVVPPSPVAQELVTIHDLTAWRFPELLNSHTYRFPVLVERALKRGAHIHTVSSFVAKEVVDYLPVEADRVHTIPNGYEREEVGSAAAGKKIAGGEYLVALGTIEPRKDYPTLLKAMKGVLEQHPGLRLVVAGAEGWGIDAFTETLQSLGIEEHVVRLGYVTNQQRADLLAGAEMLVYPSLYEGFGLPLLEAMGASTPVVATHVGAIPEVAGDACVLVPPKAVDALTGAILDVLENEDVRKHLVRSGLKRTAEYSWDDSAQQMVELYREIL